MGNKIGVLLLDFRLGDMHGDEVAYRIKRRISATTTKITLISAYELEKKLLARLKYRKYIISDIKKPISPKVLLDKVAQVINNLDKATLDSSLTGGEKAINAIIAAMDRHLEHDISHLVFKTLKLVYKIDEDTTRAA